jgi:hypothetical protein
MIYLPEMFRTIFHLSGLILFDLFLHFKIQTCKPPARKVAAWPANLPPIKASRYHQALFEENEGMHMALWSHYLAFTASVYNYAA